MCSSDLAIAGGGVMLGSYIKLFDTAEAFAATPSAATAAAAIKANLRRLGAAGVVSCEAVI